MKCEFCTYKNNDYPIGKITRVNTDQGSFYTTCEKVNEAHSVDAKNTRKAEIDALISSWKTKEEARLQTEYSPLKVELEKNVYSGQDDNGILGIINDADNGAPIENHSTSSEDMKDAFDSVEFQNLTELENSQLSVLVSGPIDLHSVSVNEILDSIFPEGTKSRAAINALKYTKSSIANNLNFKTIKKEHLERARMI